eukprot:XP_003723698.1 PREDICTED: uncharacterized protein LOC100890857 [Strongylocentrotus purpuratus]
MLKLNSEKTDFLIVASPRYRHLISGIVLTIGGTVIEPSTSIRSLGVEIDANLKLNRHVSSLSSSLHFHLSNIARIRPFLDQSACEHAVRALVSSRIDYANSLLCGTSALNVKRLQRAQNRAAKLVFRAKKYDHPSPLYLVPLYPPLSEPNVWSGTCPAASSVPGGAGQKGQSVIDPPP